jgi:septal ring factor EnvC (AmiA/AmiB activator)
MSESGGLPETREQLAAKLETLKTALRNAQVDFDRKTSRADSLTKLLDFQTAALRKMTEEPVVSLVLFQEAAGRIARTEKELDGVRSEVLSIGASIKHGQKALKDQSFALTLLPNTPSASPVVLQFKRPGDDRT